MRPEERTWWPLYCVGPDCLCTTRGFYTEEGLVCLTCRKVYPFVTTQGGERAQA